ncbi:hypothetical protein H2200_007980 [Cladophialophora chaetospira]|uniref:AB hydrolase-1 domain-containing protein n=1 Tax=Cladophialophora chaetospira TaxID=386627 RepID=A0AA39CGL0_9EURO|nr:hypothetical protein H2200_007980 [Cladophialophora chaetospira]
MIPKFSSLLFTIASTYSLFAPGIYASPAKHDVVHPGASCAKFILPVTATAQNAAVNAPTVNSNIDAINWVWEFSTWSHNATARITGQPTVSGTYGIGAQLCIPTSGTKKEILQIATHGLGFDKRYWDAEVQPDQYSYVRAALKAGYSILTYDRLGTGASDKADAYTVVQAPLQLELLAAISKLARSGELAQAAQPNFSSGTTLPTFTKVVQVGHSYGSMIQTGLLSKYPSLVDGAIQTGWIFGPHTITNAQPVFGWQFARENDPKKFGDRPSGYIVVGTKSSMQQLFLSKQRLDPKLLDYAYDIRAPGTVGEGQPSISAIGKPALNYTGPLQYFLGEYDFLCTGDCNGQFNETIQRGLYPKASALEFHIQPETAHGTTLHKNATAGYQVMFDFLARNGL